MCETVALNLLASPIAIDGFAMVEQGTQWELYLEGGQYKRLNVGQGQLYPDFVCELDDGRVLVAEYKGDHLRALPHEIEKAQVGRVWAERSSGRALFAMLFRQERGMNVTQQLDAVVG